MSNPILPAAIIALVWTAAWLWYFDEIAMLRDRIATLEADNERLREKE